MKYVVLAILLVCLAGVFHILFIMFDYGFNNPVSGAFTKLQENFNETVENDPNWTGWYDDHQNFYLQFFGIGRFCLIGLALVFFAVEAISRSRIEE